MKTLEDQLSNYAAYTAMRATSARISSAFR